MDITNELLAAYAEGNVSDSERIAVRQYLAEHPEELESVMIMMDEDFDIQLDDKDRTAPSRSFDEELDALLDEIETDESNESTPLNILPLMSKAAQNVVDNLCAVRCEGYALRALGIDISDKELKKEAESQDLLKSDGTALYSIGQLSAKRGLFVSRKYDCTINDVTKALKHGDVIIAVIDNTELKLKPQDAERLDLQYGKLPNHAVIIQSVDVSNNSISLLNPGDSTEIQDFPLDVFFEAWNDSSNYLIISNRCHYKPHPINLSNVKLEKEIVELKEAIAENAHEVWAKARRDEGWAYGPERDDFKKTDPNLLPYDLLPEKEKERFRQISMESIKFLKKLGWSFINGKSKK